MSFYVNSNRLWCPDFQEIRAGDRNILCHTVEWKPRAGIEINVQADLIFLFVFGKSLMTSSREYDSHCWTGVHSCIFGQLYVKRWIDLWRRECVVRGSVWGNTSGSFFLSFSFTWETVKKQTKTNQTKLRKNITYLSSDSTEKWTANKTYCHYRVTIIRRWH